MSLEPEKLKEIIDVQKQTLEIVKKVLDEIQTFRGEVDDTLADMKKQLEQEIHELDAFARNILEVNQKTIWKKLLEISEEEEADRIEQPAAAEKAA